MTFAERILTLLLGLVLTAGLVHAEVGKNMIKNQPLGKTPLDMALSVSDGRLFVLLEGGIVQVMSADGQLEERFEVGADVTSLDVSPSGERLFLGDAKKNAVYIFELAFVQQLPINDSAVKGPPNAPVTITVFDDFQCPYCARLEPILEQVMNAYPTQVKLVFKNFPLRNHKFADEAAMAGIAARKQGKFWPLHDQLFANYNKLDSALIRELAVGIGLDMARFDQDMANPAHRKEIDADRQLGIDAGVRGTPAVYINGRQLKDRSVKGFQDVINEELKKAAR